MTRANLTELKFYAMNSITRLAKRWWGLALVLVLCCVGFAVRAHSGLKVEAVNFTTQVSAQPLSTQSTQQGASGRPARVVKFSLFEGGIYPREIHVDRGLLAITIEDYSGGTTGLVVEHEAGAALERVGEVQRNSPHWRGRGEMTLDPGRYHVSMADRPANRALLVVEP